MNLGELKQLIRDNSEPGQCLEFYDDTPGFDDSASWFVDPNRLYRISLAKPKLLKREAAICIQEDFEGESVTRESLLDFIDSLSRLSYWDDVPAAVVLFDSPNASVGQKYLTGMWSKIEVVAPGVFGLKFGEDTTPILTNLAEAFTEGAFR